MRGRQLPVGAITFSRMTISARDESGAAAGEVKIYIRVPYLDSERAGTLRRPFGLRDRVREPVCNDDEARLHLREIQQEAMATCPVPYGTRG